MASFQEYELTVKLVVDQRFTRLVGLPSGKVFTGQIEGRSGFFRLAFCGTSTWCFKPVRL